MRRLIEGAGAEKDLIITLPGMEAATSQNFKARAYYLNAVARTIEAFTGLPMAKPVTVEGVEGFEYLVENATRSGLSMTGLARYVISETLSVGRVGLLVDTPDTSEGMTRADAEANNIHAFARLYQTEAVLDFRLTTRGARQFLSWLLLEETAEVDGETVDQLREITLTENGATVTLYQKDDDEWKALGPPKTLTRNGEPLRFIPFRFINPTDVRPHCVKPPMLDVGEVSISHLNNSASLEWGLMWTAAPTPVFVGLRNDDDAPIGLGSSQGIELEQGGNAFFLEFSGTGLSAIRARMEDKQRDMAVLGARLLSEDKKGVEAVETTRMRKSGEQSALASICESVSEAMTQVMRWMIWWDGGEGEDATVRLNTDFLSGLIGFDELESALMLLQSGEITRATFHSLLIKAELVAPTVTPEDYREELEDEAIALPQVNEP
jgi:hypothetical protein